LVAALSRNEETFARDRASRYDFRVTFLPIADRELRVSARNKATHRLRMLFAVGAVIIAGGIVLLTKAGGGFAGSQLGVWIFDALKWIAFIFACSAGVFLTSDCLSEEKRDGTLGLLFLTDLRGHDVVLGKLLATSLRTFFALLAIFPVMAFSFVLGGVEPGDFRHTLLALCNTVFFSLALGMAVSVISRDPHKAMTAALGATVSFLFLIPALDWLILGRNSGNPLIGLLSPAFAFTHTDSYRALDFWFSILSVHLAGWCLLAVASVLAPRTWHEKGFRPGFGTRWNVPFFSPADAAVRRQRWLDKSPVAWIISRDRWTGGVCGRCILVFQEPAAGESERMDTCRHDIDYHDKERHYHRRCPFLKLGRRGNNQRMVQNGQLVFRRIVLGA
jgi:ABC-type transport system involved in cytochrome c biogenesis permease component